MKKIVNFIIIIFIFIIAIPNNINADIKYDYILNSYDIEIDVKENNTFEITENIGAYFNVEKHGIYRKIPITNKIVRNDGSTSKNRAKITNIRVNDNYVVSNSDGNRAIKIGSENFTSTGQKNYTIKYSYSLSKEPLKNADEFYYNLIGTEWDTTISNITFRITMPKKFDESKLGFSSGYMGTVGSKQISYYVDGKTIIGKYNGTLDPGEAITVRLELPEGYFILDEAKLDIKTISLLVSPVIFAVISYLLWKKYGKDDKVTETMELYPPEGYNSLEIGFLFKGNASSQDVTSLLIYLANKGYLKIEETDNEYHKILNYFNVIKLKDYDGDNENEKMFLDGLFEDGKTKVFSRDLNDKFYKTTNKILENMNSKENKRKVFEKSSLNKSFIFAFMLIITFCLMTIPPFIYYDEIESLPVAIFFTGIGYPLTLTLLIGNKSVLNPNNEKGNSPVADKSLGVIFGILFVFLPFIFVICPVIEYDDIYFMSYILGAISLTIIHACLLYMNKRTKYGNEMLGKLRGFKKFLETAEKEKIESLVLKNPTYVYDVLPYAYVLGVTDTWIQKFEFVLAKPPVWYSGENFDTYKFPTFIRNTMNTANSSFSSSPSSSGGSNGGGGSSGGGSGGGGGGSW